MGACGPEAAAIARRDPLPYSGLVFAIGIMSGTSCDGVDAVMLELEGPDVRGEPVVAGHAFLPYPDALQRELLEPTRLTLPRLAELHFELPRLYAAAVRALPDPERAAVCGVHGQTVWHAPPSRGAAVPCTLQLGSPGALAQWIGLPVVGDLRAADVALGGEGAPIVPRAHWQFTPASRAGRLVVNVGGIANFTHVAASLEEVRAGDIGPGMMIADAIAAARTEGRLAYDKDAALSRGGAVVTEVVDVILDHPFFARPEPRTTGREDFGRAFTEALLERFAHLPVGDLLVSALSATAACIAGAARRLGSQEILLTGGGAKNETLVRLTRERTGSVPVVVPGAGVFAASVHEPAAMALIAARTLAGLPSALPQVTGARAPAILGTLAHPSAQASR